MANVQKKFILERSKRYFNKNPRDLHGPENRLLVFLEPFWKMTSSDQIQSLKPFPLPPENRILYS